MHQSEFIVGLPMNRRKIAIMAFFLLLLAGLALRHFYLRPGGPNVIFILCDTLRSDHLGLYGYQRPTSPKIDQFSQNALVFTQAVSAAPWTPPSMASIFTGVIPSVHGLNPPNNRQDAKKLAMRLSDKFTTLAEHFLAAGYRTQAISASPWSDPAFGLRQGFEQTEMLLRSSAERINTSAFSALKNLQQSGKPFFLYLHYMDVHKRGDNPAAPYSDFPAQPLERWNYSSEVLDQIALYDAELRYFDTHFGALVTFLQSRNLFEDTIIVLTSDHGEQFKERGKIGHGFSLHSEELHVPLIVKIPGKQGRIEALVSNLDIFSTLLDVLEPGPKAPSRGPSLLDREALDQRAGLISEGSRVETLKSLTLPDRKRLVLKFDNIPPTSSISSLSDGVTFEFFDSASDPKELTQISDPLSIAQTREAFRGLFEDALQFRVQAEHTEISDETVNTLKTLGYLGGK